MLHVLGVAVQHRSSTWTAPADALWIITHVKVVDCFYSIIVNIIASHTASSICFVTLLPSCSQSLLANPDPPNTW